MPSVHSKYSPSKMNRAMACPGSVELEQTVPERPAGEAAEYGTERHGEGEAWLRGNLDPSTLPDEERELVGTYVDVCEVGRSERNPTAYYIEDRIESQVLTDFGGTIDYWELHNEEGWARIVDLKTGMQPVEAVGNEQLLAYAALIAEKFPHLKRYELIIVQPRAGGDPVKTWVVDAVEVKRFAARIYNLPVLAGRFQPGDHCRYCPALTVCEAAAEAALGVAQLDFGKLPAPDLKATLVRLAESAGWIKRLLDEVPRRMLALMESGESIPGYKAVRSVGNRAWRLDEDGTLKALAKLKIGKRVATEQKLLSVAQLEKRLDDPAVIAELWTRPDKGLVVVPDSDKRPAVELTPVVDSFEDVSFLE